jgi:hypothetical protein
MILRKAYLFFILLFLADSFRATNDTCLVITEAQWNDVSKDKDYTEIYIEDKAKEPEKNKTKPDFKMPSSDIGGLKYVFYFLVGGAIIFLIIKIVQNMNASPAIDIDKGRVYTLSEVEEKILEIDLDEILNKALTEGDFRLALRINFLIIIKALSLSGKIIWAKEKTNGEYGNEIKSQDLALKFKEIVVPFETIWYGEHDITESQYNRLKPSYEAFKKALT